MKQKGLLLISLLLMVVLLGSGIASAVDFDISAKSGILIDAKTGQVLWEKNAHEKLPPASMTKIMTLLLAIEAVERGEVTLDDPVPVSAYAESMGGSQIYLSTKDRLPLSTMLMAIAVASANDACVAVAEFIGGTEANFVQKMNQRAKQLGMNDTTFMDTTGLPIPGHHSTAYDVALMGRELIKYPKFREWARVWHTKVQVADGTRGITNTNSLINLMPEVDGIKTGHTDEAGYCLAGSAERSGFRLVSVVMNTESEKARNAATQSLLNFGFRAFAQQTIVEKGEKVENVTIQQGTKTAVTATTADSINMLVMRGEDVETRREVVSANKTAPIKEGDKVGELIVYRAEKEVGRVDLLSTEEVEKLNIFMRILRSIGSFFRNLFGRFF